ncbi:hypothetical protein COZ61_00600 [Candidatus Berkelbacteria bacterium CG_4_8_14_3_um_filter_33_6]|uniref:Adenylate kinase n=1 Tax=Candidatus Berkelbacteria bacterium CG_4_10_14_0_2_um_filter_35_9_33_12 TaxID=1974499 RepID=A0A2M7W4L9_9BACT|nr:MAG: hypothetical protein COX10_00290 [Candidatus Berkelbacteria bacterium CG23_combo_of_CG06-09_8_20_14_all_33_15]PIS08113.1 MAG: hypothetical protein COT76_03075 [Candidatus Berkelbacteria bacterium CG10_big_fil_rev_8_21_14_0_10_33_10]PIX31296.1 MAG: hypothetical protein COZ61_00600 [Candidatus Berkelbacteria bacterium CG_4_8_14_3_um_filter_33_6]PIZ27980.1 MAG: hypothetical protein COY43_03105 [Candidatus Berkelbacteria bacterium CG_4_10_14_0_8_um_filter_35_9_33_8]PJA20770.1 MAG: hypotheti
MKRIIIFLGIQGSGKGTQANILATKHHIPIVEAGELIRKEIESNSKIGKKIKFYTTSGKMIPDRIFDKIIFNQIKKIGHPHNIIFDGFPRRMKQFRIILKIKKSLQMDEIVVIHLTLSEKIAKERIANRLVCPKCENTYSNTIDKVQECKKCRVKLEKRDDDNDKAIAKRFDIYKKQTQPVIDKLSKDNLILEFNGAKAIKNIAFDIDRSIKKVLKN